MATAGRRIHCAILNRNLHRPRVFLDRSNPLESMDGDMLFRRYRFRRETLLEIVRLRADAARTTGRSFAIPVVLAVCADLRYLATGDMQLTVGDTINLSQPTVSQCCRQVADIIVRLAGDFVQFPVGQHAVDVKQGLGALAGFPNVIGCIDCTHVWIKKPSDHPEDYIGRKGIPTKNVQAVYDNRFMIRSLVVRWPGRTHDARIWRMSNLKERFENGEHDGFLLGDSGYPLSVHIMTPYAIVRTHAQQKFNGALCQTSRY